MEADARRAWVPPAWIVAAAITEITNDDILVPTVILVGSFMVPVTVLVWALLRRADGYPTT